MTVDGTPISLGSSALVVGTETKGFTLPAASVSAETSEGIGAMIMYGLTGVGGGTVPAPVETGANNGTVAFMGDALNVSFLLKRWSIWLWALCDLYGLVLERWKNTCCGVDIGRRSVYCSNRNNNLEKNKWA